MTPAIDILMTEHRLIEKVLGSLETFVDDGGLTRPDARTHVGRYADFFRSFADRIHHGKEEDILFSRMIEMGFPKQGGPIAVMLVEHDEGRLHVRGLHAYGSGEGPLAADEAAGVASHARSFIPLLRAHIQKEDNILYPMAVNVIPPDEMSRLADSFAHFDSEVLGAATLATYHELAAGLEAVFVPDPARMEAASGMSCGGMMRPAW